jgi:hypothetical protein
MMPRYFLFFIFLDVFLNKICLTINSQQEMQAIKVRRMRSSTFQPEIVGIFAFNRLFENSCSV